MPTWMPFQLLVALSSRSHGELRGTSRSRSVGNQRWLAVDCEDLTTISALRLSENDRNIAAPSSRNLRTQSSANEYDRNISYGTGVCSH